MASKKLRPGGTGQRCRLLPSMAEPQFPHSISVILPAFNEEECIEKAVRDAVDFLPKDRLKTYMRFRRAEI